jgi:uncharacterized protein (DUF736 family)
MEYDNTNNGALFRNDKEGNDNRPDYKGPINVEGKEMQLSAWLKTSAKGVKYMSLQIEEKRQQNAPPTQQHEPASRSADASDQGEGDDIPF